MRFGPHSLLLMTQMDEDLNILELGGGTCVQLTGDIAPGSFFVSLVGKETVHASRYASNLSVLMHVHACTAS